MSSANLFYVERLPGKAPISLTRHIHLLSCILFILVFSFSTPVLAEKCEKSGCFSHECSGNRDPSVVSDCSGGMCAICPPADLADFWAHPKLDVLYMVGTYTWTGPGGLKMPIYRRTMTASECKWLLGVRFCVRTAKSGEGGNHSGKPQICAYEDPCDAMDPPTGTCSTNSQNGPYHLNTSHSSGATAFEKTYNHVVTNMVGCTDRPTGPLPPVWRNKAWFNNSRPLPTFVEEPDSVFESPRIKMKQCTDTVSKKPAACVPFTGVTVSSYWILNPNSGNTYGSTYKDCRREDGAPINTALEDSKVFCAEIKEDSPDLVTISMLGFEQTSEEFVQTLPRPGYMPKPTIVAAGTPDKPAISLTLRGQTILLQDDPAYYDSTPLTGSPDWDETQNCNTAHKVPFCIARPCKPGKLSTTITQGVSVTSCSEYQNMVCAIGYEAAAPYTAAWLINDATIADKTADTAITISPNISLGAGTDFANTAAHQENGHTLIEKFSKNLWILGQHNECKRRSPSIIEQPKDNPTPSYCQNYTGTCANSATPPCTEYAIEITSAISDPWYVNELIQTTRHLNAYEAGLCLYAPPDSSTTTFEKPGSDSYKVPPNCTEITVNVWGGGAAGTFNAKSDHDWAGGAGAHVSGNMGVTAGNSISLHIASGGSVKQADGGQSYFKDSSTLYANGGFYASDGSASNGGSGGGSSSITGLIVKNGQAGNHSYEHTVPGSSADGSTAQSANECKGNKHGDSKAPFGGGGCSGDDNQSDDNNMNGSWGKGGNGRITVQCTKGLN